VDDEKLGTCCKSLHAMMPSRESRKTTKNTLQRYMKEHYQAMFSRPALVDSFAKTCRFTAMSMLSSSGNIFSGALIVVFD
jgi:hypothetical protein